MNKHITLLQRWLDDPTSVTLEELDATCTAAQADLEATNAARITPINAGYVATAAYIAAVAASAAGNRQCTKHWVDNYHGLNN